jgi:hypothetical protein
MTGGRIHNTAAGHGHLAPGDRHTFVYEMEAL